MVTTETSGELTVAGRYDDASNWAEFAVAYLTVARIGAVLVPVTMVHRQAEVRHMLQNSGAVAVITTGQFRSFDHAAMFRGLRAECAP